MKNTEFSNPPIPSPTRDFVDFVSELLYDDGSVDSVETRIDRAWSGSEVVERTMVIIVKMADGSEWEMPVKQRRAARN